MTLEELEAVVLQLQDSVPTLEEQLFTVGIQSWNGLTDLTGATRFTLLAAPFALRVLSVDLSFEYWTLASSTVNFWTVVLERGNQALGFPDICTRTTAPSGANANGGITARMPWNFDGANWAGADLAKGELLCMNWGKTGAPDAINMPMIATVRYRPL
jgi:hypothetical protein